MLADRLGSAGFGELLEERALEIVSRKQKTRLSPAVQLEEEIELVLSHLGMTRTWVREEVTLLQWLECYLGTDLLTLYTLLGYLYWASKTRHVLKMKVLQLKDQQREIRQHGLRRVQELHERLLKTLHKLEYLAP